MVVSSSSVRVKNANRIDETIIRGVRFSNEVIKVDAGEKCKWKHNFRGR